MGSDVYAVIEALPSPRAIKSFGNIPEIEAARPCCSSGIEALCLLNNAIIKAKMLLRHCAESSKLYLALTGDAILSRCNKSRNLLELSLGQMQNMVPPLLEAKIFQVVSDLRNVSFSLELFEEDVVKVLLDLLRKNGSAKIPLEGSELQAIQDAIMWLNISSKKALLIEKRSIKKQLNDIGENHSQKRLILVFFQILLKEVRKFDCERGKRRRLFAASRGSGSLSVR